MPLKPHCLCHAIAAQAGGRTRTALALTTAAVFAKPSMGYFYAALLLISAVLKMRASGGLTLKAVEKLIVPSIIVTAVLAVLMMVYMVRYRYGTRCFRLLEHAGTGRSIWAS